MNVKELIKQLETLDPTAMVVISGYEGGVHEVNNVTNKKIALNANSSWYYGEHEIVEETYNSYYKNLKKAQAVLIS